MALTWVLWHICLKIQPSNFLCQIFGNTVQFLVLTWKEHIILTSIFLDFAFHTLLKLLGFFIELIWNFLLLYLRECAVWYSENLSSHFGEIISISFTCQVRIGKLLKGGKWNQYSQTTRVPQKAINLFVQVSGNKTKVKKILDFDLILAIRSDNKTVWSLTWFTS